MSLACWCDKVGNDPGVGNEPKGSLKENHTGIVYRGHSVSHSLHLSHRSAPEHENLKVSPASTVDAPQMVVLGVPQVSFYNFENVSLPLQGEPAIMLFHVVSRVSTLKSFGHLLRKQRKTQNKTPGTLLSTRGNHQRV